MERRQMVVLDTSVVAKWFLDEKNSDKAAEIRSEFLNGSIPIVISDLTLYELGNLLKFKRFTSDEIESAIGSLFNLGLDIIAPTRDLLASTAKIAQTHDLTYYDASFVALAQELKFNLITADEKIWEKTKSLGFVELL